MVDDQKLKDYVEFVRELEQNDYSIEDCKRLHHALLGLVTEAGELLDILKKHLIYKTPLDNQKLKDELGDLLFYWTQAVDTVNSNFEEIMLINTAKLTKRYPNGFTFEKANNRDTKGEAVVIAETIEKVEDGNIVIESDVIKQAMQAAGRPANLIVDVAKKDNISPVRLPPPVNKSRLKFGRVIPGIADRDGVRIRLCPNCGMAIAEGQMCICKIQQS